MAGEDDPNAMALDRYRSYGRRGPPPALQQTGRGRIAQTGNDRPAQTFSEGR